MQVRGPEKPVGALTPAEVGRLLEVSRGGFLGLLAGWIVTGAILMVYRAVMHLCGRHD